MEKLIFRKFFFDIIGFFLIGILSLSLIVWVIQAVNYLDFVSEDGHSFKVYFYYTLLSLPKIFSRLLLFIFFISIFYTILRYEEKNELIIKVFGNSIKDSFKFFDIDLKTSSSKYVTVSAKLIESKSIFGPLIIIESGLLITA